jgi:1-acyl-sn-glycerol-3-phosphate acyltransferase
MLLYRTSLVVIAPPARRLCPLRAVGAPVPDPPWILAANHSSFLDPFIIGAILSRRPIRWLIDAPWYERSPLWRRIFAGFGTIPTAPRRPQETVARVVAALREGEPVGVFPEGGISHDGRIQPLRNGIGWMAALSGAPVLPCGLRGAYEFLPRHRRLPRRRPVTLHVGEPMPFAGGPVAEPDPAEITRFVAAVATRMCQLAGQPDRIPDTRPQPATVP